MARKPKELRPVMVRLPETLCRCVERDAERNGRSMNLAIIPRLEQSFALESDLRDQVQSLRANVDDSRRQIAEAQLEFREGLEDMDLARGEVRALQQKLGKLQETIDQFQEGSITESDAIRSLQ